MPKTTTTTTKIYHKSLICSQRWGEIIAKRTFIPVTTTKIITPIIITPIVIIIILMIILMAVLLLSANS